MRNSASTGTAILNGSAVEPGSSEILDRFSLASPDPSWSFAELTTRHTRYVTHGYHTYPAKFIPQLAARLIKDLSVPGDWVGDPFMGSGTTLVESKVLGRLSAGTDINPVAHLIAKAKTTPIPPQSLDRRLAVLRDYIPNSTVSRLSLWCVNEPTQGSKSSFPHNDRIDYWFRPETRERLAQILSLVEGVGDQDIRGFLRCGFSNILKTASIWCQRSTKPTRDFDKEIQDPWKLFLRQVLWMARQNESFYRLLQEAGSLEVACEPCCEDARRLPVEDGQLTLIVTSPPYVTSYEYADLHQLSGLWFQYIEDLPAFRRRFIGTAHHEEKALEMDSPIASGLVDRLASKKPKTAREVATYFTDMREVFQVMRRKLRQGGRACIVIGNTRLMDVDILNAEVFAEQMTRLGFKLDRLVNRVIPSKILPQARDKRTGRFAASQSADALAYPHEYILILRKR